jgi:tetratricopeptide (TPR) repeat protein
MGVPSLGILLFFTPPTHCSALPSESLPIPQRERAYQEALRSCPANAVLDAAYSSLLIQQGQFARALDVASAGVRVAPANSTLALNQGIALYSLHRTRESLDALAPLDSAEAYFYTGLNYRRLNQHTEVQTNLLKAWDKGYRDPFLLYSLIEEDRAAGDKQAGLEHFQILLRDYPDSAWTHLVLGNAAFALEKDREARAEYAKALALNPKLPNLNFRIGFLAYQAGEDEAAEKYFREELKIEPDHSDTWLFLGETLKRRGRTREALPYLRRAMALEPGSSLPYGALATALTETNQLTAAAGILEQAEKRFPSDPSFPAQLARLLARLNRKEEAEQAAQRARSLLALKLQKQDIPAKP